MKKEIAYFSPGVQICLFQEPRVGEKLTSERKYNYKIKFQKRDYSSRPSPSELLEPPNKETHNFGVPNPSCAMLEAITTAQAGRPKH